jgi:hypothetical protein
LLLMLFIYVYLNFLILYIQVGVSACSHTRTHEDAASSSRNTNATETTSHSENVLTNVKQAPATSSGSAAVGSRVVSVSVTDSSASLLPRLRVCAAADLAAADLAAAASLAVSHCSSVSASLSPEHAAQVGRLVSVFCDEANHWRLLHVLLFYPETGTHCVFDQQKQTVEWMDFERAAVMQVICVWFYVDGFCF